MTFATQKQAQEERKLLENAKAQAWTSLEFII